MVVKIISGAVVGIEGYQVDVEADVSRGLPSFDIVGLPDSAVKEARERVRSAVKNSGFEFPAKRITINLAPADTKKEGPAFDLPIAVGILAASGIIKDADVRNTFFAGELSLDGGVRPVKGILPMVHNAHKNGVAQFIIPYDNAREAALVRGAKITGIRSIGELIGFLNKTIQPVFRPLKKAAPSPLPLKETYELDFADVKGQQMVKRAIEIAVSGGHNILMIGPPGSGKTMMAKRIPYIMPDLTFEESLEVTKIYSVAGLVENLSALAKDRPFRAPHHTISYSALTGGGRLPKPGEISLSHKGVLFLDELPEFHRNVLEVLRQPLEDGSVTVSRVNGTVTYPSDFMLVASMNPCPCGNLYSGQCTCRQGDIDKYLGKISGPLLDRIDIHIETLAVDYEDIRSDGAKKEEASAAIKERILRTRGIQRRRYEAEGIDTNGRLTPPLIEKYCRVEPESDQLLKSAFETLGLSARGYHKILKISRTIADLEQSEKICPEHVKEALQYRTLDRKYWR